MNNSWSWAFTFSPPTNEIPILGHTNDKGKVSFSGKLKITEENESVAYFIKTWCLKKKEKDLQNGNK